MQINSVTTYEVEGRVAVVTSDNPRSEDPDEIIAQILQGVPPAAAGLVQVEQGFDAKLALRYKY